MGGLANEYGVISYLSQRVNFSSSTQNEKVIFALNDFQAAPTLRFFLSLIKVHVMRRIFTLLASFPAEILQQNTLMIMTMISVFVYEKPKYNQTVGRNKTFRRFICSILRQTF